MALEHRQGRSLAPGEPGRIETAGRVLRWRTAIIATGSPPVLPALDGLDRAQALTTDTVRELRELPRRLVVLGGVADRLSACVTLVEIADRLLLKEEPEASALIAERLRGEGVDVRTGTRAGAVRDGELLLDGGETLAFDRIVVAAGPAAHTAAIRLGTVGVSVDERGAVVVENRLRTSGAASTPPAT